MRRRVVTVSLPTRAAEAEYPEYDQVRTEAERQSRGPLDPRKLNEMEAVAHRRGNDWCTAVIGRTFAGIAYIPSTDAFMLLIADEMGLEPPLPERIVEARRTFDAQRAEDRQRRADAREQECKRWELATASCPVKVTVHSNLKRGQMRELRHAVPVEDALSGQNRRHPAGRALCEMPDRPHPRELGEALEEGTAATCRSCVKYVGLIRRVSDPAPPTAAEQELLRLISAGEVASVRPARGQATIRVTTQRSRGVRYGHLGRRVDAAVKRLEAKGWAVKNEQGSATQGAGHGHLWRLTESGTAALEG
ncbi:hypothetical protein [Streptomyces sp. NPDC000880]